MPQQEQIYEPSKGLGALKAHWKKDLLAGFTVSLVALPLALGIGLASGAPPISGLISAIVGGVITTLYRGSHVAINGPANGLIVVILSAFAMLDDGSGNTFQYILAASVIAGFLKFLLGVFKMGKFGDFFPSSVIIGMLAAFGIIIISKQIHIALGETTKASTSMGVILDIPNSLMELNPIVTLIGVLSLAILIIHPRVKNRFIHYIPSQLWVVIFALCMVYLFDFFQPRSYSLFGFTYHIGPEYLVQVPEKIFAGSYIPNFSQIGNPTFWLVVLSITLVGSIETILSAKAVDKLDPHKRHTKFNKELIGVGLATMISGFVGGLPVTTVIVRSSVNVNNNAQTRWSNLFHGLILILFLLLFSNIIEKLPLAALAAILVFTGYRLASPKMFRETARKGWEQVVILSSTLIFTLTLGLLWGIFLGIVVTVLIHYLRMNIPPEPFFRYLKNPFIKVVGEKKHKYYLKIKGISNFINILKLKNKIEIIPEGKNIIVDFSHTRLVDYTVLEYVHEYGEKYVREGGKFDIIGLDIHKTSTHFPYALHVMEASKPDKIQLSKRQTDLKKIAFDNGWSYHPEMDWDTSNLRLFEFFKIRPIEFKKNIIHGSYPQHNVKWEFCDVTFDEGALIAKEVYHISLEVLYLPFFIPRFTLEKEKLMDKLLEMARHEDIDFEQNKAFSEKFLLKGPDEKAIRSFFTPDLIDFFNHGDIYHLESNGNALLVFKNLRLASPSEVSKMIRFSEKLIRKFSDPLLKNGIE